MIDDFHSIEPYGLKSKEKEELIKKELFSLTAFHYNNCELYRNILNGLNYSEKKMKNIVDFPFCQSDCSKN